MKGRQVEQRAMLLMVGEVKCEIGYRLTMALHACSACMRACVYVHTFARVCEHGACTCVHILVQGRVKQESGW